jgi:translation initiation factor IF-3
LRLIDAEGHQVGIFSVKDALNHAKELDLDIVLISKDANPPVCKMLNFGKFKYDEQKKQKANKHHVQDLKEVKISPRIQEHDIDTQVKKVNQFLSNGDKVKITCVFKSREMQYPELGKEKINFLLSKISVDYHMDKEPAVEKNMHTILSPVKK